MQLIERLRLYGGGSGCPFVGIPFADGSKMIFSRKVLQIALSAPVIHAELTEQGVLLTGRRQPPSARYYLFDLLKSGCPPQWTIREQIIKG